MKKKFIVVMALCLAPALQEVSAQQVVNDNNTPLHLMQPAYRVGYGVPTAESVKQTIDRVLRYIDSEI